jgi:hypothetical protein
MAIPEVISISVGDKIIRRVAIINYELDPVSIGPHDVMCEVIAIKHSSSTVEYVNPNTGVKELQEIQNTQLLKIT